MKMNSQAILFKEDEIFTYSQWDDKRQQVSQNQFPRVGGRLRLAHDMNESLSISTEIVKFDEEVAVVIAHTTTDKGSFSGMGTASTARDQNLASAILELAETRAIARSLRFAGYGMEYCSAEEISHLQPQYHQDVEQERVAPNDLPTNTPDMKERLSSKQLDFILALGKRKNLEIQKLEKMSFDLHGVRIGNLLKAEASAFIDHVLAYETSDDLNLM